MDMAWEFRLFYRGVYNAWGCGPLGAELLRAQHGTCVPSPVGCNIRLAFTLDTAHRTPQVGGRYS